MPKKVKSSHSTSSGQAKFKVQSKKISPRREKLIETSLAVRPSFSAASGQGILAKLTNFRVSKKLTVGLLIIVVLAVLLFLKTSWFIAATVNGLPITNFELLSRINKQYREPVLTQLINEKIIKSAIQKSGVSVSQSEIDKSISQIELNVGGAAALDGLLSQQGQSRADLREQLKLQLSLEKMYEKEATVSAEEISEYIEKNKSQLTATDSAGQTKEAEGALKQQNLQKIFAEKFEELRNSAKVTTF